MQIRTGILTISDRGARGERPDLSGPRLKAILTENPEGAFLIAGEAIVSDDPDDIQKRLLEWADIENFNLILTTGGTGFSPRDLAPEATLAVIKRPAPGFAEAMRAASLQITPHAMISRAVAGIRDQCLIINLPGSPKAAAECLSVVMPALPHALAKLLGDSSDCAG